jgi:hypothetical protein
MFVLLVIKKKIPFLLGTTIHNQNEINLFFFAQFLFTTAADAIAIECMVC